MGWWLDMNILRSTELIETFLDGLEALVDGRGWGIEHQKASDEIHRLIDTHEELVKAGKRAIIALDINGAPNCEAVKELKKAIK
jgi:hypothetical protein